MKFLADMGISQTTVMWLKERCFDVIHVRDNETPHNVIKRLQQVLNESSEALLKGSIISVEETRHRVRLLPL